MVGQFAGRSTGDRLRGRRRRRARLALTLSVLFTVLAGSGYASLTLLAPLQPTVSYPILSAPLTAESAEVRMPSYGASAVGAVGYPGLLAGRAADKRLPMASITKLITALVTLEAKPLEPGAKGPNVTIAASDTALWGYYQGQNGNVAPVHTGLVLTQRHLLQLTLIESANNYATTLARWAYGNDAAFVSAARAWLEENGLTDITVVEPSGIDPRNTATASALVELGRIALADPTVMELVGLKKINVPGVGSFENSNKVLGTDGVTGLKTGMLDSAGYNLLFSATQTIGEHEVQVIGVILGAARDTVLFPDVRTMLGRVEAGFREVVVVRSGEALAQYRTEWGEVAEAAPHRSATMLVWGDTPIEWTVTTTPLYTADAGDEVGRVTITAGPNVVSVPLYLSADLHDPGPMWRLTNPVALLASR